MQVKSRQLSDRILVCASCDTTFAFTASEQLFYATHGVSGQPKRCEPCRRARREYKQRPEYRMNKVKQLR